ncbi:uncharacterized protein LOC116210886 [Punica granatum]|uniref:Uncharacterized protein LOC116210886 n=2 Tax=Punica granatum TaxID=22663 RepID=A0A6P8E709_PUNGR|nr:uncharacterized protein LOC116210886 [Punica granatum]PKI50592.1 hypothetical protein CRG98_029032 [Punica granatum]
MEVVKHSSHHHALRPFTVREDNEGSMNCSGCEQDLSAGSAYRCTKPKCDFFLHSSCFCLLQQLNHGSHPCHTLTLHPTPPYPEKDFICNACGETSSAFTYHCSPCTYDLHVACAHLPMSVKREDHPHPLTLLFPSPDTEDVDKIPTCDVCYGTVTDQCWIYRCEQCDFHTHLTCATEAADQHEQPQSDALEEEGEDRGGGEASDDYDSLLEAQRQLELLRFQNQMSYQNAQFMMDMGRSLARLA